MALLQLVAFSALPTADAVLDASQLGLPLHVESESSAECAPHHDHLFCQVVRSLTSVDTRAAITAGESAAPVVRLGGRTSGTEIAPRRFLTRSVGPRAPPLA